MADKPRLAVVVATMEGGGTERAVSLLLPEWMKTCHVRLFMVVNQRGWYPLPAELEITALSDPWLVPLGHLIRAPLHARRLRQALAEFRPDGIIAQMEQANILTMWAAPRGVPVVLTEHSIPHLQYNNRNALKWALFKAARRWYPKAKCVACVSNGVALATQAAYRLPDGKTAVVYNPIHIGNLLHEMRTPPPPDDLPPQKFFLAASRIVWRIKGHDLLLRAFWHVAQSHPDCSLVIAGDGPDRAKTEALARELGLSDRVRFVGWQKQVGSWMGQAVAFVAASRYEGLQITLLEAMACGCPVVATDCESGPAEVLENGNCGWLAPVEDIGAIAEGMKQILVDADLRERYRAAGLERVKAFTPARVAKNYISALFDSKP